MHVSAVFECLFGVFPVPFGYSIIRSHAAHPAYRYIPYLVFEVMLMNSAPVRPKINAVPVARYVDCFQGDTALSSIFGG